MLNLNQHIFWKKNPPTTTTILVIILNEIINEQKHMESDEKSDYQSRRETLLGSFDRVTKVCHRGGVCRLTWFINPNETAHE